MRGEKKHSKKRGERIKKEIVAAGTVALLIMVVFSSLAAAQEVVFKTYDPEGDDYGYGDYTYPLKTKFVPGSYDLVSFEVSKTMDDVIFTFGFKTLGGNPWDAPENFSSQFIYVLIDKDGVEGSGRTDTRLTEFAYEGYYLNLAIDPRDAWEVGLSIGPSYDNIDPQSNQITIGTENYLYEMNISADQEANLVIAKAPMALIGEPTENWGYVVIVGSWIGGAVEGFRQIEVEAGDFVFGGADPDALAAGVLPKALDILVPEGMTQENILKGYDAEKGTFATVYAVTVSGAAPTTTTTTPPPTTTTTPPPTTTTTPPPTTTTTPPPGPFPAELAAAILVVVIVAICVLVVMARRRK